jgi:septum formation protein
MVKQRIILASTSPRRHGLAQEMGLEFDIIPSSYEEDMSLKMAPEKLAMHLSEGKAEDVAKKFKEGIVLGVDTFIVFNGQKLGKPKTKENAYKLLKSFSGKKLKVISGVCLIDCSSGKKINDYDISEVKMRKMTDDEINQYIATGEPLDKAGAFAVQGLGSIFIEKISGSYTNIVGFPVNCLYKNLRKLGVNIFEYERWQGK